MFEKIFKPAIIFVGSGVCEIFGGFLVWAWLKESKPLYYGLVGFCFLILYGYVATLQKAGFARTYATYGGVFIVMSLGWGWFHYKITPNKWEILGTIISIIGAIIIFAGTKD